LPPDTSRSVEWREPTGTPLIEYDVNYRGGLPEYPKSHGGGIKLRVWPRGLQLNPTIGTRSWFTGLGIPIEVVTAFEIAQRQVSTVEGLLGGLNSRQLNQANNIHITFWRDRIELVLRLEMLSGTFVMAQAGKCRDLMDRLRGNGMLGEIERNRSTLTAASAPAQVTIVAPHAALPEGIPDQIRKLAALRDEGILTSEEFEAKKAELLSRL
jgi:hypothetical protein